jgi:hypothetical protein
LTQQATRSGRTLECGSVLKRLARRHTTAVAYLALFAAFGGSAHAAGAITGKNIRTARSPARTSRTARSVPTS